MRAKKRIASTMFIAVLFIPGPLELMLLVQHIRQFYGFPDPLWFEIIGVWGLYLVGLGFIWWLYGRRRV